MKAIVFRPSMAFSSFRRSVTCSRSSSPLLNSSLVSPLALALLEIVQVRRRLVLARRHQQAVRAQHVVLLADGDVCIALGADVLEPDEVVLAAILLGHHPGTAERIVDGGDLIEQNVGTVLVEGDALL